MEMKKIKIGEVVKMLENGNLIREKFQRTPSHAEAFSSKIIESIINGYDLGVITCSYIDNDKKVLSILDGSSRLNDIQLYLCNEFGYEKEVIEVYKNDSGDTLEKTKKSKLKFNKLSESDKKKILDYELNFIIHNYVDINDRMKAFIRLNTSVALSTIQKQKGLSSNLLEGLNEALINSEVVKSIFTSRAIQKDEIYTVAVNVLANLGDCYSGTQARMLDSVKDIKDDEVDINKLYSIIQMIDNSISNELLTASMNKYNLIHIIIGLYNIDSEVLENITIDNNLVVAIDTKGANSKAKNDERNRKQNKAIKKAVELALLKVKQSTVAVAPTEEIKEIDLNSKLA